MNGVKQNVETIADLEPILPLDTNDDSDEVKSSRIGVGFGKENFRFNVEYYWCDKRQNMCRRVINPTSYAEAAFCSTMVIGKFVPKKVEEVKIQPSFDGHKEEKPDYETVYKKHGSCITSFNKNINTSKTFKDPPYSQRRKHKTSKRNKVVKHYKLLEEFNYFESDQILYDYDYYDYDDDYYDDYYYNYWHYYDDYCDDYSVCRGPYSDNFSRCFGMCCN